ncbi:MAG TPA: DUF1592 domain-containing protein [Chryseosolibacter sp.]|jgi:hypothetical protein|nr:DUF1592 domain-containing protein [Chryseosolibacter sp.]
MLTKTVRALVLFCAVAHTTAGQDSISYERDIRPVLAKKCFECHNTGTTKGDVNLDNYKEQGRVIKDGQLWLRVLDQIKTRHMPPKTEPRLSEHDYNFLIDGINSILQESLDKKSPGRIVIRRLGHSEYHYTIMDLVGIDFDARNFFPSDGSGGGGFDNQGRALFFTPLKLERYYDAATVIIDSLHSNEALWSRLVPISYHRTWWQNFCNWMKSLFSDDYDEVNPPELAAQKVIYPFATKAYRHLLKADEKAKLIALFRQVYDRNDSLPASPRFDEAISETFKAILVSPNFLYRVEEEPEREGVYPASDFELATRLSYFLWSSMPDQELFNLAYLGKLQDTLVLEAQVRRMLRDPKAKRLAESFSSQWLGITRLLDDEPFLDPVKYPDFDLKVRKALYRETVEYFYYVLSESKNLLDLINSDYTFLNKELADYYCIPGVTGDDFCKVTLSDSVRGGVLGMGSVLAATSVPTRTSPVLRGKWVLEQILGISPPPPPPIVNKLEESEKIQSELGLRKILELHRSKPDCQSCHEKMDPLGLGLENFDAGGRWRTSYGAVDIDASGVMEDGQRFTGPVGLKKILLKEKEKIARNLSSRMLSYALGRSILFTDEPALRTLDNCLLQNDFNPELFIIELVKSYPFTMKQKDFEVKV